MSLNLGSLGMEDASFNFGGSYIMALDCGTTSVLATIVDEYSCIVAQARRSVKTSFPRPGWIEQDPMEVLASQIGVMMEVQFKSGIHSDPHRRHRYLQPARDHGGVGPHKRPTHL